MDPLANGEKRTRSGGGNMQKRRLDGSEPRPGHGGPRDFVKGETSPKAS